MRRSLWFAAGAGAGVYLTSRARRAAESLTLDGWRDRASGLAAGARLFRDEVAAGREEKETELRQRLGLVPTTAPELGPAVASPPRPTLATPAQQHPDTEGTT